MRLAMRTAWTARRGTRVVPWAAIVVMAVVLSQAPSPVEAQPSPCSVGTNCDYELSVETVVTPVQVGANADVDVSITYTGDWGYSGYGASVTYDSTIVSFVPVGYRGVVYTGLGGMSLPAMATDEPGEDGRITRLGSAKASGSTTETGVVAVVRYQCIALGTATLRLVPPAGPASGSRYPRRCTGSAPRQPHRSPWSNRRPWPTPAW